MKIDVKVPAVGESITEAVIGSWAKKAGDFVKMNEVFMLLETDKASVEVAADKDGILTINAQAGETVLIGATVGSIDTDGKPSAAAVTPTAAATKLTSAPIQSPAANANTTLSPAVQRIVNEKSLDASAIQGTGPRDRVTKEDALNAKSTPIAAPLAAAAKAPEKAPTYIAPTVSGPSKQGDIKRVPMTNIRKKIAERLVQAQHNAACLTTFNEIDMTKVIELRTKYKDKFKEKYGVNLGFNGFFVKAAIEALKAFPGVNAWVDGTEIEYHNYYNIGIAVSTDRGLMVPVVKDADSLSVAGIELAIRDLAFKGRDGKITPNDLTGGTFSITNGGVFGSLLSTPILNAPQSAILGLHKVEERAVVINGKIEVRSMMYAALTYDHRMVDGKEAVSFLVKIKEGVEDPERLLIEV
ncbi:MAG: 2-oxoglutarate dehydrogenase complex dihydrolipoyllysine-residue succinyltransferase [Bdellovibrionaceae bacterium]|nr:2-oxoglutarate dehydrogenase complex dihydrolipoyllysine-residue succinyltransferase [Pseudobdellovibrionaceae bacterium]